MSAGFTPGPWQIVDNREMNGAYWICHPDQFTSHAEVRSGSGEADDVGDVEANARLIAAAPDLYEALEWLASVAADARLLGDNSPSMDRVHAALAKARGETA